MKNVPVRKKARAKALRQEKAWHSREVQIAAMGRVQRALRSARGSGREETEMKKRRRRRRGRRGRRRGRRRREEEKEKEEDNHQHAWFPMSQALY